MAFDFEKNNPETQAELGYEFEVLMPDGSKTGAFITVRGAMSATVKNYSRKKYQEFKVRDQQAKRRGRDPEDMSLDEAEDLAAESATERIIDWKGIAEGSKEVKFSKDEAKRLMKKYAFMREQVMEASDNVFNFSKS